MNNDEILTQEQREHPDPRENLDPVPIHLHWLIGLLLAFCVVYIGTTQVDAPSLDPAEVARHPLRVGLSMAGEADAHNLSGKALADAPSQAPAASTAVLDNVDRDVDEATRGIVERNGGTSAGKTGRAGAAQSR